MYNSILHPTTELCKFMACENDKTGLRPCSCRHTLEGHPTATLQSALQHYQFAQIIAQSDGCMTQSRISSEWRVTLEAKEPSIRKPRVLSSKGVCTAMGFVFCVHLSAGVRCIQGHEQFGQAQRIGVFVSGCPAGAVLSRREVASRERGAVRRRVVMQPCILVPSC